MAVNELKFEIVVDDRGTAVIQKFEQAAKNVNKEVKESCIKTWLEILKECGGLYAAIVDVWEGWNSAFEKIFLWLSDKTKVTLEETKNVYSKAVSEIFTNVRQMLKKLIEGGKSFVDVMKGLFNSLKANLLDNILDIFEKTYTKVSKKTKSTWAGVKAGWEAMLEHMRQNPFVGAILGAIGGLKGAAMAALGAVSAFIKGDWISGIIQGVGAVIGAIIGLFKKPEWKKIYEDVKRDLGEKISESLAKKIEKTAKRIGDRYAAISVHLADIIKEVGLTTKNFETFGRRANDILFHLDKGLIDAGTATKSLNDAFSELAKGAEEMGITFSRSMIDIIKNKPFWLEIKSISEFVNKKLNTAVSGLSKMIAGMSNSQEEFNRVARVSLATLEAMKASGNDYVAVLEQLKPCLDELAKKQEEWGLEGNEALNELNKFSELVTKNKALVQSVQGMTDAYSALGSIGALTEELFSDWQNQALTKYDQLIAAGFSENEALRMIAPTLTNLAKASETFGFELSDSMENLYDMAKAQDLIEENPFDRMNDSLDRMVDILERIAEKWGVTINRLEEYGDTLSDLPSGGGWEQETGWGGRGRTMQFGTPYVPSTGWYKLHQGEAIIPASQNRQQSMQMGGAGGQVLNLQVVVPVTILDEELTPRLFRRIYDGSKKGEVKIHAIAVEKG